MVSLSPGACGSVREPETCKWSLQAPGGGSGLMRAGKLAWWLSQLPLRGPCLSRLVDVGM